MSDSSADAAATRPKSTYKVVVNHEEQYSIWPTAEPAPLGWKDEGTTGSAEECLAHVEKVWTDMRPKGIRDTTE